MAAHCEFVSKRIVVSVSNSKTKISSPKLVSTAVSIAIVMLTEDLC